MTAPTGSAATEGEVPSILVPEVRDFVRINAELVALLDRGHRRVRLDGVDGQRLLLAGLAGAWEAIVEVDGRTGPELAANLDAPGLRVVARGATRDGAGSGLRAGSVLILGTAGAGLGYAMTGGTLVVVGDAGDRAGLDQRGGVLAVLGASGRLAGDRQGGGTFFEGVGGVGPYPGRGQRGGRRVAWTDPLDPSDRRAWDALVSTVGDWVDPAALARPGDA